MIKTERRRPPPAWLSRQPLLQAWWLEAANGVQRWGSFRGRGWTGGILLLGLILAAGGCFALLAAWFARALLPLAGTHLLTVGILMGLQGAVLMHRGRQTWTRFYTESWLATVPVSRRAQNLVIALRACGAPLAIFAAVTALIWTAGLFAELPGLASAALAACLAGTSAGMAAGWWLPHRDPEVPAPPSSQVRGASRSAVGLSGISRWPIIQTKVWLQPRSIARLMLICVALPMGMPANIAVALMWMLIVGTYLLVLMRATVHVAREGARWLRPTPLGFGRFAWAVLRLPLLKQLQWTVMAAIMLMAMKANPGTVLRAAELWLALFSAVSSVALANTWQARGATLKMVLSVAVLALLESLRHHFALPCALLFSGWQLRKTVRT